jgi:hypothetical protein
VEAFHTWAKDWVNWSSAQQVTNRDESMLNSIDSTPIGCTNELNLAKPSPTLQTLTAEPLFAAKSRSLGLKTTEPTAAGCGEGGQTA